MIENPVNKKSLILVFIFSLGILLIVFCLSYFDRRTKIVFCDVGQGDAAYIRVKNKVDILVDTGPDKKVLNCLGKHMPFWDRKFELVIISHPQKDHFGGLLFIVNRYKIDRLYLTPLDNPSQSFQKLKEKIHQKKISVFFPLAGTKIKILDAKISFYWPTEKFIKKNVLSNRALTSNLKESRLNILGASSLDDNNFSLVFIFETPLVGESSVDGLSVNKQAFRTLFTGDATPRVLNALIESDDLNIDIIKIPHHGSKNGLTKKFLELANPKIAVISVGKNNPHGHPNREVLEMLKAKNIKIQRTDENGDIIFYVPLSQNSNVKTQN